MKLSCFRAHRLLQRRAAGLSAAAGLYLEEHLSHCDDCRSAANLLSGLRQLALSEPAVLSIDQRVQLVAAALAATPTRAASPTTAAFDTRKLAWFAMPALALLTLFWLRPAEPKRTTRSAAIPASAAKPQASGDRVLSGQVDLGGAPQSVGQALSALAPLHTASGATLALAHATVELRADSTASWNASRHELQLISGSVLLDVDPARHQAFSVKTERFSVIVLGTQFEVSLEAVRVLRGRVRVVDLAGAELAVLDEHEQTVWRYASAEQPDLSATQAHNVSAAPKPSSPPIEPELARVRALLASRDVGAARRSLKRVLALALSSEQRAEALSLRADCALVNGQFAEAGAAYLSVASEFAKLPAGETALFAAARIEAEHGRPGTALQLFKRYQARYPAGRFSKESAARLQSLASESQAR